MSDWRLYHKDLARYPLVQFYIIHDFQSQGKVAQKDMHPKQADNAKVP